MSQELVWTINVGGNIPYLWVEVNGVHYKTYSQSEPRRVRAKHDDALSLFDSPGWDTNSQRKKGALL